MPPVRYFWCEKKILIQSQILLRKLSQPLVVYRRASELFFKDVPGGQKLGATYDYIHRLLDFKLAAEDNEYQPPEKLVALKDTASCLSWTTESKDIRVSATSALAYRSA